MFEIHWQCKRSAQNTLNTFHGAGVGEICLYSHRINLTNVARNHPTKAWILGLSKRTLQGPLGVPELGEGSRASALLKNVVYDVLQFCYGDL